MVFLTKYWVTRDMQKIRDRKSRQSSSEGILRNMGRPDLTV
jgi:hypothetical protein